MAVSRSVLVVLLAGGVVGVALMPRLFSEPKPSVAFDAKRALSYLDQLCKLGSRVSGSEGMTKQQTIVEQHFTKLGAKVTRQVFNAKQVSQLNPVSMTNLVVTWHPERDKRVILCCHYDTRPIADQETDRLKWNLPFDSANDGTSSVAWLMELGNHIKGMNLNVGVDFVFFDGEEYIFDNRAGADKYFFGSEHFANDYFKTRPRHKYLAGVLFDLCAGANPRFPVEKNSQFHAGAIVNQVWMIASELKEPMFVAEMGQEVLDDHIALNKVGIPTIDIIDFDYPHWHRLSDTPDKVSGDTMTRMSRVICTWLSRVK